MGSAVGTRDILAILFGFVAFAGVFFGGLNRFQLQKSIGTQFIRYTAIVVALPAGAALAFQGLLTEAIASFLLGALGYAFAGAGKDER
jgi:uncharacterized membrane protein YjjB (DUF3815 family)